MVGMTSFPSHSRRKVTQPVIAEVGLLLEDPISGFVGEVIAVKRVSGVWTMTLEGPDDILRTAPLGAGWWIEDQPVELLAPNSPQARALRPPAKPEIQMTVSGSIHADHRARVAKESRIWVEGKHDAELVIKIWAEDLRYVGVVIEELGGVDHLAEVIADFAPDTHRRIGVMVDHLVPGSKESRIAAENEEPGVVKILGHPYIDIWHAIKPATLGLTRWPDVPRGEDFKKGTLARLGWPHETAEDVGKAWAYMLSRVTTYTDLEPAFLAKMEELIDFVCEGM